MTRLVAFLLLAFLGCCFATPRIVGGDDATVEMYPSIVQVEYFVDSMWDQRCGANILNNLYVMSAAHCFHVAYTPYYHRDRTRIRAGSTSRNAGGTIIPIIREYNHPNFNSVDLPAYEADINVVRLSSPLIFSDVIKPAMIPSANSVVPDDVLAVNAGWGTLWYGGPMSPILQAVELNIINSEVCRTRYRDTEPPFAPAVITSNMICAGILDVGGYDTCHGDSGGPLYWQNVTIGVISFGHLCATPTFPGVNTNVASYSEWLVEMASQA